MNMDEDADDYVASQQLPLEDRWYNAMTLRAEATPVCSAGKVHFIGTLAHYLISTLKIFVSLQVENYFAGEGSLIYPKYLTL